MLGNKWMIFRIKKEGGGGVNAHKIGQKENAQGKGRRNMPIDAKSKGVNKDTKALSSPNAGLYSKVSCCGIAFTFAPINSHAQDK